MQGAWECDRAGLSQSPERCVIGRLPAGRMEAAFSPDPSCTALPELQNRLSHRGEYGLCLVPAVGDIATWALAKTFSFPRYLFHPQCPPRRRCPAAPQHNLWPEGDVTCSPSYSQRASTGTGWSSVSRRYRRGRMCWLRSCRDFTTASYLSKAFSWS